MDDPSNVNRQAKTPELLDAAALRDFYDRVYYAHATATEKIPRHYRQLAKKFQPWKGRQLLDVACGTGQWLGAVTRLGAVCAGIDISQKAIEICRTGLPAAELECGSAERLPFPDGRFDVISCLGALEHFLNPRAALGEMVRVAKPSALFVLLVPNSGFLPARLGLYAGTEQTDVREDLRSLSEWRELFESVGLTVRHRWRDLHVISPGWICRGSWPRWPLRAGQAFALPFWPLAWQYQVYHLCTMRR